MHDKGIMSKIANVCSALLVYRTLQIFRIWQRSWNIGEADGVVGIFRFLTLLARLVTNTKPNLGIH